MYTATRRIEIDAGHRVMTHGSKCKHLHGHRYKVEATFSTDELISEGVETGMVKDFGVLKRIMHTEIHNPFDHKLIICIDDDRLLEMLGIDQKSTRNLLECQGAPKCRYLGREDVIGNDVIIIDAIPTAENLAELWCKRLSYRIGMEEGQETPSFLVDHVDVFETPNCKARYYNA